MSRSKSVIATGVLSLSLLAGCAGSSTIRTSSDTANIKISAAPVCGSVGAANVAQQQAAIETIKAGFDRYIILAEERGPKVGILVWFSTSQEEALRCRPTAVERPITLSLMAGTVGTVPGLFGDC